MTPAKLDPTLVTQEDRDAAASAYFAWISTNPVIPEKMQAGKADCHSIVQAFARHRLAAIRETTEKAAALIEETIASGYPEPERKVDRCDHGKFGWEDCIACYDERWASLAAAIRSNEHLGEM